MKSIKCRKCGAVFVIPEGKVYQMPSGEGVEVVSELCPKCGALSVALVRGKYQVGDGNGEIAPDGVKIEVVYPLLDTTHVDQRVPERFRTEFGEAQAVLQFSPKASAALSRRVLQMVLREHYDIKARNLKKEIEKFCERPDVPNDLKGSLDYIRKVGNVAAHPMKIALENKESAGIVLEVDRAEAEWLLSLLEVLFEYAFIRPSRDAEMKRKLEEKFSKIKQ